MPKVLALFFAALMLVTMIAGSCIAAAEAKAEPDTMVFYLAPEKQGTGDGLSEANARYFRDFSFWLKVQLSLRNNPVTVYLLPGQYVFSKTPKDGRARTTLRLEGMGNPDHKLTVQGLYPEGTIFTSDPEEPVDKNNSIDMLYFNGKNAVFRYLHFTGEQHMGYATRFLGQNVLIENCSWVDLPHVYYGASGTAYETSDHIIFKDSVFKRVGLDSHAHMIYNAYGPKHVYVINSYFEDCSGEFVRFRDQTDYAVVFGSTFKSTGTYVSGNTPFVTVPLFNDDNPENPGPNPRFEYFGTHMLIANNTFIYPDDKSRGTRQVFRFLQSGYNPPGRSLLLDAKEAIVLLRGSVEEKRQLMHDNLGLDGESIHFFGNKYVGEGATRSVVYYAYPNYGAKGRGWNSAVDITDAVNATPVVSTAEEAMAFWENETK